MKKEAEHSSVMISGTFLHFHSNLSSLPPKYLSDILTDRIVLSCGPKISKRPLLIPYWWLKSKERKFHLRFV